MVFYKTIISNWYTATVSETIFDELSLAKAYIQGERDDFLKKNKNIDFITKSYDDAENIFELTGVSDQDKVFSAEIESCVHVENNMVVCKNQLH